MARALWIPHNALALLKRLHIRFDDHRSAAYQLDTGSYPRLLLDTNTMLAYAGHVNDSHA